MENMMVDQVKEVSPIDSLREEKAAQFLKVFGPDINEAEKIKILAKDESSDLKQLVGMLEIYKKQASAAYTTKSNREFYDEVLSGKGNFGQSYVNQITMSLRDGELDSGLISGGKLAFSQERINNAGENARHVLRNSEPRLRLSMDDTSPHLADIAVSASMGAMPQSRMSVQLSKGIPNAVALDMAIMDTKQRAEIMAANQDIQGVTSLYASEELKATTPSEKASLPHFADKLVKMALNNHPAVQELNVSYAKAIESNKQLQQGNELI